MSSPYYESNRALAEYLLFHYGSPQDNAPPGFDSRAARNFPARCISEGCDPATLGPEARALDLGCGVGRASFELARHCGEVIGIDYSANFIAAANHLRQHGSMPFECVDEGELTHSCLASVSPDIARARVSFQHGDALALPADLGTFDVVLLANLLDRVPDPRQVLEKTPGLVKRGGQLIITSPFTWLLDYTPHDNWLGGFKQDGREVDSFQTVETILSTEFELTRRFTLPFVIREHVRKYQYCMAEAGTWIRR